jgi:hypothetical protein
MLRQVNGEKGGLSIDFNQRVDLALTDWREGGGGKGGFRHEITKIIFRVTSHENQNFHFHEF